jgi:hypothetical protein
VATLLLLTTVLAPWANAMPSSAEVHGDMQIQAGLADSDHESMNHSDMQMDSMNGGECCDLDEGCTDCESKCTTCPITSVLLLNPALISQMALTQPYQSDITKLYSNIPPPPNKPPV